MNRFSVILAMLLATSTTLWAEQQTNLQKGFHADKVYASGDLDHVNLFNGNLNVTIPIGGTFSAGGSLTYGFMLSYGGNVWDYQFTEVPDPDYGPDGATRSLNWSIPQKSNAGLGWRLSFGKLNLFNGHGLSYESPDGGEHQLYDDLHGPAMSGTGSIRYTKDGTYIRYQKLSDSLGPYYRLDFPDGTQHEFRADGEIRKMVDRFGNYVLIDSAFTGAPQPDSVHCGANYRSWRISDTFGREHYLYFRQFGAPLAESLCQASLVASHPDQPAGSAWANYYFEQKPLVISRQFIATDTEDPESVGRTVTVPLLTRIILPEAAGAYGLVYDIGKRGTTGVDSSMGLVPDALSNMSSETTPGGFSGHLMRLTLPTGGEYQWTYREYSFPELDAATPPTNDTGDIADHESYRTSSVGVKTRTIVKAGGVQEEDATWSYAPGILTQDLLGQVAITTTMVDPEGNTTTSYFAGCHHCPSGYSRREYSLPFTRHLTPAAGVTNPVEQAYLSSRTVYGDGTTSSTYVAYEDDPLAQFNPLSGFDMNRRANRRHTVTRKGTTEDVRTEVHSDFDGHGHYRTTTTTGSGLAHPRVTRTNFNPGTGPTGVLSGEWIANTFDSAEVREGTATARTEFCFDAATGFLTRQRIVTNPSARAEDLMTVFRDADATGATDGNVSVEQYYGGPNHPFPSNTATCDTIDAQHTPEYTLRHTYEYGARSSTRYDGVNFLSLDADIDPAGAVRESRDTSGVATRFSYDLLGRLKRVVPTGSAWTEYVYSPYLGASSPASVTVKQWKEHASATGTELTSARYSYDRYGRIIQESRRMPAGWSTTWTEYDRSGRKSKATVATSTSTGAFLSMPAGAPATRWTYDKLGRILTVAAPDAAHPAVSATVAYDGNRITRRSAAVAGAGTVTNEEETDAFGRLVRVTESLGNGPEITLYEYDLGDRLTKVTMGSQERTFTYNFAGLLTQESHPESGLTTYSYDSRGHLLSRSKPAPLTFAYDTAERQTDVFDGARLLKKFFFDESSAGDRWNGKLARARRYNYHPALPGGQAIVEERYDYSGPGGAVSWRTTSVSNGGTFTDQYTYDDLGAVATLEYPECTGCPGLSAPPRTVTTTRSSGFTTGVSGYTSGPITYHPSGLVASIPHRNVNGSTGPVYRQLDDLGMGRPKQITVEGGCTGLSVTSPASQTVEAGQSVTLQVTGSADTSSYQWYERASGADVALSGKTAAALTVIASSNRVYFARIGNGTCTVDSESATVTVGVETTCSNPAAGIAAPESVTAGTVTTASVAPTEGASYNWTLTGSGQIIGSSSLPTIQFTTTCGSSSITLSVTVTTACTTETSAGKSVAVVPPTASVSGSTTIQSGGSAALEVTLSGVGPWALTWSDGVTQTATSPWTRTVFPNQTRTYTLTSVVDTGTGCTGIPDGSATITVGTTNCEEPDATIQPLGYSSFQSSGRFLASVWVEDGVTYEWTLTNATVVQNLSGAVQFRAGCSGDVTIALTATAACGKQTSSSVTIPIDPPAAVVTPDPNRSYVYIPGGPRVKISAAVTASSPTITWSDGTQQKVSSGGTTAKIVDYEVAPAATTTYRVADVRDSFGCPGVSIGQVVVSVCNKPDATITAPASAIASTTTTASVPALSGATYAWTIANGTIVGGANIRSVSFKPSCSGTVTLTATVTSACGAASTVTRSVVIQPPAATVTGTATIAAGSNVTIGAAMTGTGAWTVRWADQASAATVSTLSRTLTPAATTTYSLASVTDSSGCVATLAGSAVITVVPPAPSNLVATASVALTQVALSWSHAGQTDRFDIYRDGVLLAQSVTASYIDTAPRASSAHLYRVVAVRAGTASAPSNQDIASTVLFTDDPLVPGVSAISDEHITQLRVAVNALRFVAGLPSFTYVESSLAGATAKPVHLTNLRDALTEARTLLGLPSLIYRPVDSGVEILASDLMEIRGGVR